MADDQYIPEYQTFTMTDYERSGNDGLMLAKVDYLLDMFDIKVDNEKGKPIQISLVEKSESFQSRK